MPPRWLYHLLPASDPVGDPYAPASLAAEGYVHASYRDAVRESARLYFSAGVALTVLQIDPRRLAVPVEVAPTPRGPTPHVHGPIPAAAVRARFSLDRIDDAPDAIDAFESPDPPAAT